MEKGLWLFSSKPLILKKWEMGMKLQKEAISKLPVWVMFNVPTEYWTTKGLSYIASIIG